MKSTFCLLFMRYYICFPTQIQEAFFQAFFFIMMGCYRWNSAATTIIISPQLTNYYYRNYPKVSHSLNTECNVLRMGDKEIVEKQREFGKPVCWQTQYRNKMVMKTKCYLWMVDTSKIMSCFSCHVTDC